MIRTFAFSLLMMVGVLAAPMLLSEPAYSAPPPACPPAQTIPKPVFVGGDFELGGCASRYGGSFQPHEFTSKLVFCVEGTIRDAMMTMMNTIMGLVGNMVTILCTLVIIFYGVRVATGERDLLKRTMTLAVKLAFVGWFINNLDLLVVWVFGSLDQLLTLVTGGLSPWIRIDAFLGNLFGTGSTLTLINGVIGLVGAAAFSSTVGVMMFFTGIMAILKILTFILSLIFTYLQAYLAVAFMLMLAPIFIPLSLFFYTERYFKKWSDIIVAIIMTPVLLFAFLWMFIGIFDVLIENIFSVMGGKDFKAYWRNNQPIFSWLMPSDPNDIKSQQNLPTTDAANPGNNDLCGVDRGIRPPTQLNINPFAQGSVDAGAGKMATLDFGANDVNMVTKISLTFTTLWIFSSLMTGMITRIPELAQSIGAAATGIQFGGGSQMVAKMQQAHGAMGKAMSGDMAKKIGDTSKEVSKYTEQFNKAIRNRK